MFEEETPQVVFSFINEDGSTFRDALTFSSMSELRNTSTEERRQMMQERYDNWKQVIATPPEELPQEES